MQALAEDIQAAGGIVTAQDLQDAQPTVKQPLTAKVSWHAVAQLVTYVVPATAGYVKHLKQKVVGPSWQGEHDVF